MVLWALPGHPTSKIAVVVSAIILLLCSCTSITPYANFKDQLYRTRGSTLADVARSGWAHSADLIGKTALSKGHMEYGYRHRRSCNYFLEVDPVTTRIVGTRFEGETTDCVIYP